MAKWCHTDVIDGAWNIIKNNATLMILCSAQPTNRTKAVSTYALADVAVDSGDFNITTGDVSGRKCVVAAKNAVPVDVSGTGTHIAIVDGTRLLYVTTTTSQAVTSGNSVNLPSWEAEIPDPS